MTFIKGTELDTYIVVRIKPKGRKEHIESFHDEQTAKAYIVKLMIDHPATYEIVTINGGQIQ